MPVAVLVLVGSDVGMLVLGSFAVNRSGNALAVDGAGTGDGAVSVDSHAQIGNGNAIASQSFGDDVGGVAGVGLDISDDLVGSSLSSSLGFEGFDDLVNFRFADVVADTVGSQPSLGIVHLAVSGSESAHGKHTSHGSANDGRNEFLEFHLTQLLSLKIFSWLGVCPHQNAPLPDNVILLYHFPGLCQDIFSLLFKKLWRKIPGKFDFLPKPSCFYRPVPGGRALLCRLFAAGGQTPFFTPRLPGPASAKGTAAPPPAA